MRSRAGPHGPVPLTDEGENRNSLRDLAGGLRLPREGKNFILELKTRELAWRRKPNRRPRHQGLGKKECEKKEHLNHGP